MDAVETEGSREEIAETAKSTTKLETSSAATCSGVPLGAHEEMAVQRRRRCVEHMWSDFKRPYMQQE